MIDLRVKGSLTKEFKKWRFDMGDKDKGVGTELSSVHRQCGKSMLTDYSGYVFCNHCEKIVNPEDVLSEEEYLAFISEKTEKYRKA